MIMLGGVFRVQCIFPYIEGEAVLNVRTVRIYGKKKSEKIKDGQ